MSSRKDCQWQFYPGSHFMITSFCFVEFQLFRSRIPIPLKLRWADKSGMTRLFFIKKIKKGQSKPSLKYITFHARSPWLCSVGSKGVGWRSLYKLYFLSKPNLSFMSEGIFFGFNDEVDGTSDKINKRQTKEHPKPHPFTCNKCFYGPAKE